MTGYAKGQRSLFIATDALYSELINNNSNSISYLPDLECYFVGVHNLLQLVLRNDNGQEWCPSGLVIFSNFLYLHTPILLSDFKLPQYFPPDDTQLCVGINPTDPTLLVSSL